MAWDAAGLPVIRGKKGDLCRSPNANRGRDFGAAGAVLGYFVDPRWIALSGFVGAGLIFRWSYRHLPDDQCHLQNALESSSETK